MTVRVVQVTNISTQCQKEQIRSLFANIGRIDDIQLYPDSETLSASFGGKVGYIKYDKSEVAQAALQLTNTVFIDKALICSLVKSGKIPDETEAIRFCAPLNPNITLIPGGVMWNNTIINRMVVGNSNTTVIETIDPALAERSLPHYPPLSGTIDPLKVEEIRRTVFVSNIQSNVSLENLNDLFSQVGEVRFIRFAGDENASVKSAYIEFSEQPHIIKALCLNGLFFGGKHIKVNHATCSIIKPATSKQIFASREKSPKHSSSRKRSKSPSTNKSSKKRSSRSPRRRSSSRSKRSKSPHKRSSTSKKHSHDREKRRRSSSSKAKKRSRSKDRKRSKSKDVKKRRSSSRNRESSSNKSNKKSESNRQSSSGYKSSRNRSRSKDKHSTTSSSELKKSKSKDDFPSSSPNNRKDKIILKSPEQEMDVDSTKYCLNGKSKTKEIKLYGPNPPPIKNNASSSSDSSSSSNSSSSDEDDDEDEDENKTVSMDH